MDKKGLARLLRAPFTARYGFIAQGDMPRGSCTDYDIPLADTRWATTYEFSDMAANHCAAVAVMNLALYFTSRGCHGLLKSTRRATFRAVHDIMGNGPVFRLSRGAREYLSGCGCRLEPRPVYGYEGVKAALLRGRPCALLVAQGLIHWHWVFAVGYREYTSGEKYLRVVNGWSDRADSFYEADEVPVLLSATEYRIDQQV